MRRVLKNRFSELLAIKERREGRNISQREVSEMTGAALSTVNAIAQNKQAAYIHRETIEKLMAFLDVTHVEFFETVLVEDEDPEIQSPLTDIA